MSVRSVLEEFGEPNGKRSSELVERLQGRVPDTQLNTSDVAAVETRVFPEALLRPALSLSQLSDSSTQYGSDGLAVAAATHVTMFRALPTGVSRLIVTIDLS